MDVKFPIGELQVPDVVTKKDVEGWLEQTRTYAFRLRKVVDGLSGEELEKTYREGAWSVRQLVHHIADSQLTMYQRLKLALTDDWPTVPAFDQDEWALLPDMKLPVESSIRLLEGLNERIVALGETLETSDFTRGFIHATDGKVTVGKKLAKLAWHEEHHLAHIKIALNIRD